MATEFVGFQPPPRDSLAAYNRKSPPNSQPTTVPKTFKEAMEVREEVFVKEQHVPLENELDEDDARSFHWVVYASVGNTAAPSPGALRPVDGSGELRRGSESTAMRVPVGTIRLVPPPHKSHDEHAGDNTAPTLPRSDSGHDHQHEPYVKLGRLAVLKPYRRLGLSKLLINAATNWAIHHIDEIVPPLAPSEVEAAKAGGKDELLPWNGLILVHAQASVQHLWEKFGFVKDEGMGTWDEEGMDHVGLWKRVEVKSDGGWRVGLASPGVLDGDRRLS